MKKVGTINCIMLGIGLLLILALFLHGLPGVISWLVIKLVLPFAGLFLLVIFLILFLYKSAKKQNIGTTVLSLIICVIYIAPILLTMHIIPVAYPENIHNTKPAVTVQWPMGEETVVGWGGDSITMNMPHAMWGSERWAYDLVMEPYDTGNTDLASYGIWSKEVFSPVNGTVVAAFDDEIDSPINTEDFVSLEGNYVYICIEETGTYLLLNHLKQNSVTVSVGDVVKPGDLLGTVGNSGTSSEPHLHIHHQRQDPTKLWVPIFAEGLPLYFTNHENIPMPVKGDIVNP